MSGMYIIALLVSIAGLGIIDYKLRLAYFYNARLTLQVLIVSVLVFVVWDVLGIRMNIFFIGSEKYLLGLRIGEFPLEEIFFLVLLNYCTLITYIFIKRKVQQ